MIYKIKGHIKGYRYWKHIVYIPYKVFHKDDIYCAIITNKHLAYKIYLSISCPLLDRIVSNELHVFEHGSYITYAIAISAHYY